MDKTNATPSFLSELHRTAGGDESLQNLKEEILKEIAYEKRRVLETEIKMLKESITGKAKKGEYTFKDGARFIQGTAESYLRYDVWPNNVKLWCTKEKIVARKAEKLICGEDNIVDLSGGCVHFDTKLVWKDVSERSNGIFKKEKTVTATLRIPPIYKEYWCRLKEMAVAEGIVLDGLSVDAVCCYKSSYGNSFDKSRWVAVGNLDSAISVDFELRKEEREISFKDDLVKFCYTFSVKF